MPDSGTGEIGFEAQAESGDIYRALVEGASDLITVVDRDGRLLFVNSKASQVFGCSSQDCLGQLATDFTHPDDIERMRAWLEQCIADRQSSSSIEYRQVGSDGGITDVLWSGVFHYDGAGNLLRVESAGRNVTGLRQAQRELEGRISLLEDAQRLARLGHYVYDVATSTWSSSRLLDEILGLDDAFVRDAEGWLSLVHADDRQVVAEAMSRDLRGEVGPMADEYRMVRRSDGQVCWIRSLVRLYRDASGKVERITGTVNDITERRLAEESLISAKEELAKHSALLEEAQSIASLGYYDYNVSQGYWTSSPIMDSIFGIDEHYVRSLEGWLGIVHPSDREMMGAYVGDIFARQASFDKVYRIARICDGEMRWVHGLGKVTYDEAGTPLRMLGTISDITNRKMLEVELEGHRQRVAKLALDVLDRSEHERRLIAAELHDGIAQLLAAARLSAGQLMQDCAGTPSEGEAQRLGELLSLAIADARSLTVELSHPVLRKFGLGPALISLAGTQEDRFGLRCSLEIDPLCHEMKDRSAVLLYRIIRELLNNVHKHSGVDRARIVVSHEGESVTALVEDAGRGFDLASQAANDAESERFGLRNVREELELAGGQMLIETAPGQGTSTSIRIPVSVSAD